MFGCIDNAWWLLNDFIDLWMTPTSDFLHYAIFLLKIILEQLALYLFEKYWPLHFILKLHGNFQLLLSISELNLKIFLYGCKSNCQLQGKDKSLVRDLNRNVFLIKREARKSRYYLILGKHFDFRFHDFGSMHKMVILQPIKPRRRFYIFILLNTNLTGHKYSDFFLSYNYFYQIIKWTSLWILYITVLSVFDILNDSWTI